MKIIYNSKKRNRIKRKAIKKASKRCPVCHKRDGVVKIDSEYTDDGIEVHYESICGLYGYYKSYRYKYYCTNCGSRWYSDWWPADDNGEE